MLKNTGKVYKENINGVGTTRKKKGDVAGQLFGRFFCAGSSLDIQRKGDQGTLIGEYDEPQEPLPGSWHKGKHLGDYTHYGDQAMLLYDYEFILIKECRGEYTADGFKTAWRKYMNSYNGYMDKASKESLKAFKKGEAVGSESDELGGAARIAPVLYFIEEPATALEAAVSQSRLTHNSELSLLATELFARMILKILEGEIASVPNVLRDSLGAMRENGKDITLLEEYLSAAEAVDSESAADIAKALGQSCHASHAIPVIFKLLLTSSDYRTVLSLNARIGGDSATRGMIIGAILGANNGMDNLPADWLAKVKRLPEQD